VIVRPTGRMGNVMLCNNLKNPQIGVVFSRLIVL